MRTILSLGFLVGCGAGSTMDDAVRGGPPPSTTDSSDAVDTTCSPAPEVSWLDADPSTGERLDFDGTVALEFVSAPVSRFWASPGASDGWSTSVSISTDGYKVPVVEATAWTHRADPLTFTVTWPTDHGPDASSVDLCTATFSLDLTLTELGSDGTPRNDGACASRTSTTFRLEPGAYAADLCPLFLPSEATLERLREQEQRGKADLAERLGAD